MWWLENRALFRRSARLAAAFLLAGLTAACFQPLYGTQTIGGGPALRDRLAAVDVMLIDAASGTPEARIGVELRNALIYDLSGGESPTAPNYRLKVQLVGSRSNRDGLGATVKVRTQGRTWTRYQDGKSGYLSQSSMPLYFGFDPGTALEEVEILWPSGQRQILRKDLPVNGVLRVVEPAP